MIALNPILVLLLLACVYILAFGALTLLRREGLSIQFAVEAVLVTAILVGGSYLAGHLVSPFVLVIVLYLVTMRSRLLSDLGNLFARRDRYDVASSLYRLALAVWPDTSSQLTAMANRGAAELRSGRVDAAIQTFEHVLQDRFRARVGLRYESICRYNLGLAYQFKGADAQAVAQFKQVIELLPGSPAAVGARTALKRYKEQS